ncbi:restriction endonuclease subunit S [Bizionia saleffrena]|uniref:restriction endonuclease subunit S n=1 Tax=Bizionia saleffrena TaxID=291189 RepID=UPI001C038E8F|nr:restriction endonuclease subunit S [Bizionia saleffrena]
MNKLKTYKFSDSYEMSSGISSKPEQAGHGSPFLSFSTVFNNEFVPEVLPDLMSTSEKEKETYSIKEGDIFLTRTSETLDELGMSCVAVKDYPKASYSGFLKRLRPTQKDITYPKFMAFYLRSYLFRKTMNNNAIMTLRASLNEQIFSYLDLILPSYEEQVKVGDLFYRISEKIEVNNKINQELEAMAKTLYDYWFVQFDFPDVHGKPYKSSGGNMVFNEELKREIPEGWRANIFDDVLYTVNDSMDSNDYPNLNYLPIDKLPSNQLYYQDYSERKNAKSSLIRFKEDDILLGAMRVYFHRVCNAIEDGISRSTIMVLRPHEAIFKNFCLFTLNRKEAIEFANINSTGSSIPYAKWDKGLSRYKISTPNNLKILENFNKVTDPILENFKKLSKQNQKLSEVRDWLLPMLMNGQVTVGEVESELGMVGEEGKTYNTK